MITIFRFLCSKRYFFLFFDINNKNLRELSKKHGTVSHLSIVTDQFTREGLITKEPKGREVEILLTNKGKELSKKLKDIYDFTEREIKLQEVKNE